MIVYERLRCYDGARFATLWNTCNQTPDKEINLIHTSKDWEIWHPSLWEWKHNMSLKEQYVEVEFTWTDFLVRSTKSLLSWSSLSPSLNFPGFDSTMSEPVKEPTDTQTRPNLPVITVRNSADHL